MEYTDQTAHAIRLYLIEGEFDMEQFTVLKTQEENLDGLRLRFGILGESHFVTYTFKGHTINEICACTHANFKGTEKLYIKSFLNKLGDQPVKIHKKYMEYVFEFTHAQWVDGKVQLNELRDTANQFPDKMYSLSYIFPSHTETQGEALTEIYVQVIENTVNTRSIHTYPNEGIMVFTNSTLHII